MQEKEGLEQWNPRMKGEFPMRASMLNDEVFPAFGVEIPELIEGEYGFWISSSGNVHDWGRGIVNSQDFDATSDDDN